MTRYVVDPPALLELVRSEHVPDPAHHLVAPNALRSQALELLLREVASGSLAEADALELHERITTRKIRLLGDRVSRRAAWRLARDHGWDTLQHAEYLAVTRLQADALIAADGQLAAVARELVPVAPLSDLFAAP